MEAGFAALHWACRENKLDCVTLLLEASATVDVRAADAVTPFMLACKGGHHDCAKMLAKAGADVEAANVRGGSAMVVACVMGAVETVRLLLSVGADPDAVSVAMDDSEALFQCRPIVTACRYNQPKIVSLLLGAGVSNAAMTTALAELEAFPSFHECARLVRRAVERKGKRQCQRQSEHGLDAPTDEAAAAASRMEAEARAEAARAALLAEEEAEGRQTKGQGRRLSPYSPALLEGRTDGKRRRKKAKRAGAQVAAQVAAQASMQAAAQAAAAQAAATQAVATQAVAMQAAAMQEVARAAREEATQVDASSHSWRDERCAPGARRKADMNALASEYREYHQASGASERRRRTSGGQAVDDWQWLSVDVEEEEDEEEDGEWLSVNINCDAEETEDEGNREGCRAALPPRASKPMMDALSYYEDDEHNKENRHGSRGESEPQQLQRTCEPQQLAASRGGGDQTDDQIAASQISASHASDENASQASDENASHASDENASQASDENASHASDDLSSLSQASDEISQLELFLHRQKFTTSAMSFFLAKVREGTVAARHAVSASACGPPAPLPTPPLSAYEIMRRSRKARRPAPPPGCLPSPQPRAAASAHLYARASAPPTAAPTKLAAAGDCFSGAGGCAWFCPLERRLEQEMEAARAREMALHAALRQRSEAILELDEGRMKLGGGEMSSLPSATGTADGGPQSYYERRKIEEWLMSQSLARCRARSRSG